MPYRFQTDDSVRVAVLSLKAAGQVMGLGLRVECSVRVAVLSLKAAGQVLSRFDLHIV